MLVDPNTRLACCLAASLVLHALLLIGSPLMLLPKDIATPPLDVVLAPVEPPPPLPKPKPKPHVKPRPAPQHKPREPVPPVATIPAPDIAPPVAEPAPPVAAPEPAPAAVATQEPAPPPPSPVVETPKPEPRVVRQLPRRGSITYALYLGTDKFNIGKTLQTWELDDKHYKVSSASQTTGLAAMFKPYSINLESSGSMTAEGLRPESFSSQRGRSGEEQKAAQMNWVERVLVLKDGPRENAVSLRPDTYDALSFMYQLALTDIRPGRMYVEITNGAKLEIYGFDVGAEETLDLPLGKVSAIPVRKVRGADEEGLEFWLAPAYRYLPVRVRFLDREGKVSGEQLATEIRVSDDAVAPQGDQTAEQGK